MRMQPSKLKVMAARMSYVHTVHCVRQDSTEHTTCAWVDTLPRLHGMLHWRAMSRAQRPKHAVLLGCCHASLFVSP